MITLSLKYTGGLHSKRHVKPGGDISRLSPHHLAPYHTGYITQQRAPGMSIWLPQASRQVHRVTALHATRASLKYAASDLANSRHIQRQFASSLTYNTLFTPYYPLRSRVPAACRSYATSNPANDSASSPSNTETNPPSSSNVPAEPIKPLRTRIWAKVKHEAAHYWHGSKLLVSEMRISLRLVFSLLQGKTLTRREKRQVRTNFMQGQVVCLYHFSYEERLQIFYVCYHSPSL